MRFKKWSDGYGGVQHSRTTDGYTADIGSFWRNGELMYSVSVSRRISASIIVLAKDETGYKDFQETVLIAEELASSLARM